MSFPASGSDEFSIEDTSNDGFETPLERAESSESGMVTEMEHRRSESMSLVDLHDLQHMASVSNHINDRMNSSKKGNKSRALSKRVARGLKKHIKGEKSRPRSLSPPRSQRALTVIPDDDNSPGRSPNASSESDLRTKKKHKSKFKPVAKAAAAAAKKLKGKKSKQRDCQVLETLSAGNSRSNTPVNTPLEEDDSEDDELSLAELPTKFHQDAPTLPAETTTTAPPAPAPSLAAPTEDEALKLAEAMAMAVQSNPTKSQEEIRRMVYSQPEFKHLAPPEAIRASGTNTNNTNNDSTSYLLKKNFSSIKKQLTSGAGTAQKKFLEMAESNLGSSITSFSFGIASSSSSSAKASTTTKPPAAALSSSERAVSAPVGNRLGSPAMGTAAAPVTTIPENSQLSLEDSMPGVMSMQSIFPPTPSVTSTGVETSSLSDPLADAATSGTTKKWRDLPITISDIVWKRRSGFGKFSTDAWERRRFVLQGNVLSYYRAKGENSTEPMDDETEQVDDTRRNNPVSMVDYLKASSKGSSKTQRMYEYMEQVAASAGLAGAVIPEKTEEEKRSARGYMDLIKENAVICATQGHSGAPSPFCLSIKVGGETKWKLCFSSHRSQLQWMAAISDVVVQASVDAYNVKLLTKADPANHDPTQAFLPSVYEPPADDQQQAYPYAIRDGEDELLPQPSLHVSGKRLWIMEPYVIRPQDADDANVDSNDDDEESVQSSSSAEEEDVAQEEPIPTTTTAEELVDDRDVWFLPEKKLLFAAIIVNASLFMARNSCISVQTFWTMITVANMSLWALLETKPRVDTTPPAPVPAPPKQREISKKRKNKKSSAGQGTAGIGDDMDSGDPELPLGVKIKMEEPYKPMAGLSALRVEHPDDPNVNSTGDRFTAWRIVEGETVQVRSHGYMTTKAKVPSPGTLYELAQMDIFESPQRYPDMAPRVILPKLSYDIDPTEEKTWKAPDHFVVSLSLPTDPPKLGASATDGGGYTLTMYYTMRRTTRDILKRVTADEYDRSLEEISDIQKSQVNGVRLFDEWCRRAPQDMKFQSRFKMVPNVDNAKEIGLPSWIGKYNGKPLLIKRPGQTGFLLPHPELSCIEYDISLHVFPYLAKQGICYMKDSMFKKLLATVGFVIEGREDDELPEVLIGLGQICYPDPDLSMQASAFFAGSAPRSYNPEETKATQTLEAYAGVVP